MKKKVGVKWWNMVLALVIIIFASFTFFSFLYFFRLRKKKTILHEFERTGCKPNFRPIEFITIGHSDGFYFDSYIVHPGNEIKLFLVPLELTKRTHFKTEFPFPPPEIRVRLIHYDNSTTPNSESDKLNSEVVVCQREVCAYSNHEYFRSMSYTHVYTCEIPKTFEMDEELEHGLHFTIQQDKNRGSIYYAPDCSNEPHYEYTATTLLKNEKNNVGFWIRYLLFVGFDHIYIYDHGSDDGTVEYLLETFPPNKVTVWDASNHHKLSGEDYLRKQSMQLTDTVYRLSRNGWIMNLDVDEFPVFLPNLQTFTSRIPTKVKSLLLPSVMFSNQRKGSDRLDPLKRFTAYSKIISPYETLPLESIAQQRTKVLFQPENMLCAFPHAVCSDSLDVHHQYVSVSESYFSHFYDRAFPKPFNGRLTKYISYYEKMEPYHFVDINKRLSDLVDLYCPLNTCTKNEKEVSDQTLWELKMDPIKTKGYLVKNTPNKDLTSRLRNYHCPRDLLYRSKM